jgi:hypothetical protein
MTMIVLSLIVWPMAGADLDVPPADAVRMNSWLSIASRVAAETLPVVNNDTIGQSWLLRHFERPGDAQAFDRSRGGGYHRRQRLQDQLALDIAAASEAALPAIAVLPPPLDAQPLVLVVNPRKALATICKSVPNVVSTACRFVNGYGVCPLMQFVISVSDSIAQLTTFDPDVCNIGSELVRTPTYDQMLEHRASALGVSRQKLTNASRRIASLQHMLSKIDRRVFDELMVATFARRNLLAYDENIMYDETPMKCVTHEDNRHTASRQLMITIAGRPSESSTLVWANSACMPSVVDSFAGGSTVVKLLQMQAGFSYLVNVRGQMCLFIGRSTATIQVLASTSAVSLLEAQLRHAVATPHAEKFGQRTRASCTDSDAACFLAERGMSELRPTWTTSHTACEDHLAATCHKQAFVLNESDVTGFLNSALVLTDGLAMQRYRRCFKVEFLSRLKFTAEEPFLSVEALTYKRTVMSMFMSHGADSEVRRSVVCRFLPFQWTDHDIYVYLPPDSPLWANVQHAAHIVVTFVTSALAGRYPKKYNRHRWVGADLVVDYFGTLECIYKMHSSTMRRFMLIYIPRLPVAAGPPPLAIEDGEALLADAAPLVFDPPVHPDSSRDDAPAVQDEICHAELNARNRTKAFAWSESDPLGNIIRFRICLEPLRELMESRLYITSQHYDIDQDKLVAESLASGLDGKGVRGFRLKLAASMACREHNVFDVCMYPYTFNKVLCWLYMLNWSNISTTMRIYIYI